MLRGRGKAAKHLSISVETLDGLVRRGELLRVRTGRVLFSDQMLSDLIARRSAGVERAEVKANAR